MDVNHHTVGFSERYAQVQARCGWARETDAPVAERVLQCIWYDQALQEENLSTTEGHALRVISPGWWNQMEGPDFRGAQIEFNGKLYSGDVEVHRRQADWKAHGHQLDSRYDEVILHVVFEQESAPHDILTAQGRRVSTLVLRDFLQDDIHTLSASLPLEDYPQEALRPQGQCAEVVASSGIEAVHSLLRLAGEWRMLNKARVIRDRMDRAGGDQAVYEALMYACGFSQFKHHFRAIARHLPYERARQLSRQDPMLLETALLQIAGLLPGEVPGGEAAVPHFARLRSLRRDHLDGLRSLPLTWRRAGVRPNNNPERRLAGIARFIARTAAEGLLETLEQLWRGELTPLQRRHAFEDLFPNPLGFWATHCTWTGKKMERPIAPIGADRIRSIIGNVFIPAGLALARKERDRVQEEKVFALFSTLPKEQDNHIIERMLPRMFGDIKTGKLNFQLQQGLLQIYQDWCEANPSCRNCSILRYLESGALS